MTFTEPLKPVLVCKLSAAAAVMMLCTPAMADDHPAAGVDQKCALPQLASLPITVLSDGQLGVTVMLAGKSQILALDIGDPYSYLTASYVKAEGLAVKNIPRDMGIVIGKTHADAIAIVPEFGIGAASGKNVQFAEFDDGGSPGNGSVGELALNILSTFDVELDLANNRLNLFSRSHCLGNVVYWADSFAAVPFVTDASGHPSVNMQLDGRAVTVAFTLRQKPAFMAMATAKRLWGKDETAPGMTPVADTADGAPMRYRYPFKQLSIKGITIANPQIDLYPNSKECRPPSPYDFPTGLRVCYGASELELGLNEMRQLHVFFSFKEKKIYLTAAGPDTAKDQPAPTGAPAQLGKTK